MHRRVHLGPDSNPSEHISVNASTLLCFFYHFHVMAIGLNFADLSVVIHPLTHFQVLLMQHSKYLEHVGSSLVLRL